MKIQSARKSVPSLLLVCLAVLLVGCGTTGNTKVTTITPTRALRDPVARVELGAVEREPAGTRLDAVAVFRWGEFTEADLQNLSESLRNSIAAMQTGTVSAPTGVLKVFVMIRRHHMVTSSSAGACIACVGWCVVNESGEIIHHEQFYASASSKDAMTVGGIKNAANKAILQRIGDVSAHLASAQASKEPVPAMPPNAYTDYDEATRALPKKFVSGSIIAYSGKGYSFTKFTRTGSLEAKWDWAKQPELINWEDRLKGRR